MFRSQEQTVLAAGVQVIKDHCDIPHLSIRGQRKRTREVRAPIRQRIEELYADPENKKLIRTR